MKTQLSVNGFDEPEIFKVEYEKSKSEIDIHTILIAGKKTTA
jgi:hypothetical protein